MSHVACHMSHVTCRMSHITCLMSNAYVDPWDMLNNFCFHVYAQKWVFVYVLYMLMLILGTCWTILFSCLCAKVSICNYVTCHISPFACHMLYIKCFWFSRSIQWRFFQSPKIDLSCRHICAWGKTCVTIKYVSPMSPLS